MALTLTIAPGLAAQAHHGRVTGRVMASGTLAPLRHATVEILGTDLSVRTDGEGRFTFEDVPSGRLLLRTSLEGYVTTTDQITVSARWTSRIDVHLEGVAAVLGGLLVTGRTSPVEPQPVRSSGTALEALVGTAPGLSVIRSDQVGGGSRILIRGINSLTLPSDPAIYIDGIRVFSKPNTFGRDLVGPGILDLVPVENIDSVRVLRGPSAAARYGAETSNGVILIFTKRGGKGGTRDPGGTDAPAREDGVVRDPWW